MLKRLMAGVVALGALLVFVGPPADAQTYGGTRPNALTRSSESCAPGGPLTLTVEGALPATDVTFIFDGPPRVVLGIATANADGVAVLQTAWPDSATPGFHNVTAQGVDDEAGAAPLELTSNVQCGLVAGEPLARTGSDSLPWVRIGVVLVALGGIVLLTSRKRYAVVRETV